MVATLHPTSEAVDSVDANAQADYVRGQFVVIYLQQNRRGAATMACGALMSFGLMHFRFPGILPLLWIVGVELVMAWRYFFADQFIGSGKDAPFRIGIVMLISSTMLAMQVLAFNRFSDADKALISLIMMSTSNAAVVATGGYKNLFLYLSGPLLLPLGLGWALCAQRGDAYWEGPMMGGLIVIYQLYLVALGRDVFHMFDESCRIRFAEHGLNSRLASALEDARQAGQAKTRFLAAASHDLRQPLHSMGMLLAALGLRALDARSREIVRLLGNVSQSLSGQLDGLLDISKLDAGIVVPDFQPHRLDQLVQAHVAVQSAVALQKGLHIHAHCEGPVLVMTDAHLLQRVLGNLTSNALKFTANGGVDVFVKVQSGHAVLEVVDTGLGITAEQHALVFQEFYQVGNPERDRSQGLGLGLAIVQRVCALLGIGLELDSVPGRGSTFGLRLPLADVSADIHIGVTSASCGSLPSMAILVVDDEVDVRKGMRLLLEELGCRVLLADSVAQAGEQARTQPLDMVISDLRLRNFETGFEAVQAVSGIQPGIYVLLISGDTAPDRLQQAHEAGFPLLHKPVTLDALMEHIRKATPSPL